MTPGTPVTLIRSGSYSRRVGLGKVNAHARLSAGLAMVVVGSAGEFCSHKVLCQTADGKVYSVPVRDLEVRKAVKA